MTRDRLEFHEAANIFPLDEEHLDELAEDIRSQGLQVPIETLDGRILDGRRRYLACEKVGVEPQYRSVRVNDPIAYVLSLNLHRRHLSPTQLGMVGARARKWYDDEAKRRQKEGQERGRQRQKGFPANLPETTGDARDHVGKVVGVGGKTIDCATKVLEKGTPQLIAAVEADQIAVSSAARAASLSEAEQNAMAERAAEAASNGRGPRPRRLPVAEEEQDEEETRELKGVGVIRAHEALNHLTRIPKNDPLRKRGFQIVTDWIKRNP